MRTLRLFRILSPFRDLIRPNPAGTLEIELVTADGQYLHTADGLQIVVQE